MTVMIPIYQICTGGTGKLSEWFVYACGCEGRFLRHKKQEVEHLNPYFSHASQWKIRE